MGARMKTTVEISKALLEEAKKLAARERTTLKRLIEQGLRQALAVDTNILVYAHREDAEGRHGVRELW